LGCSWTRQAVHAGSKLFQSAQKELLDKHMEKYNLQDQDWGKQMMKKKKASISKEARVNPAS
jgi:hypothetical protein